MQTQENLIVYDSLIIKYLKEELTPGEKTELIQWVNRDKANKRYFDEFCEIWIASLAVAENSEDANMKAFHNFRKRIGSSDRFSYPYKLAFNNLKKYAAVFIIACALSGLLFYNIGKKQVAPSLLSKNELVVPFGSKAEFTLADGTKVTLNAGSKLEYSGSYGITDRTLQLEGEAYFKVAKNGQLPFIVKTSHVDVRALGTEFNVKAYPGEKTIETTLVEGSVNIDRNDSESSADITILKPNQKFTYYINKASSEEVQVNKEVVKAVEKSIVIKHDTAIVTRLNDVAPVISWKENKWIIENQNLQQLAVEMERKFDVKIIFNSERLKNVRFTGTLLNEPIEQVLMVMGVSSPLTYKIKGKEVFLFEGEDFNKMYKDLYQ
jgi:ferric-dicitrate binding protein FerR (iron transport regulator)